MRGVRVDPEHTFLESDDEFEGVGAHPDNPRFDHDTALADHAARIEGQEADGDVAG